MNHKTTLNVEQIPADVLALLRNGEELQDDFPDNAGNLHQVIIRRERRDYADGDYEYTYEVYSA